MWCTLRYLCLATVVLCIEQSRTENVEAASDRFQFRRAIDGRRGRRYYNPIDDGSYDSYEDSSGYYDASEGLSVSSDIRRNVPGEPGVDYPMYTRVPKTRFTCEGRVQGYYADEDAGCQAFHVCHNVVVSSFVCPIGSIFSQELLICDWWNKVDCSSSKKYHMSPEIYTDDREMVQKAQTMIHVPERHEEISNPSNGAKIVRVKIKEIGTANSGGRGSFATSYDRHTRYYENEPVMQGNVDFRRDQPAINFNFQSRDFERNNRGQNNDAKDSAIVYVQKNIDYNSQASYSSMRPSILGNNSPNLGPNNFNDFRNEFRPSYAPTVPTVTTTTRRLYSPTVPTTYRPATISYDKYEQGAIDSDHPYSGDVNLNRMTTQSTTVHEDRDMDDRIVRNPIDLQRQATDNLYHSQEKDHSENQEEDFEYGHSIGIVQAYGERLTKAGSHGEENAKAPNEEYEWSREENIRDAAARMQEQSTSNDFYSNRRQQNDQLINAEWLPLDHKNHEEINARRIGSSAENYSQNRLRTRADENQYENNSNIYSQIPPLIVQIPRPSSPPGLASTNIVDQLYAVDSLGSTTYLTTQPTRSKESTSGYENVVTNRVPPLIFQPSLTTVTTRTSDFTGTDDQSTFKAQSWIPPLIPQFTQPAVTTSTPDLGITDDQNSSNASTRIPPLILQTLQPAATTNTPDWNVTGYQNTFNVSTRIPPLIPQSLQPTETTGSSEFEVPGDEIPSTRIPPLIPGFSESASTTDTPDLESTDDENTFSIPTRIPPMIPQSFEASGTTGTPDVESTDDENPPTRIPPMIPQPSQPATTTDEPDLEVPVDENTFVKPTRIPPLIPGFLKPAATTDTPDLESTDDENTIKPPTRIPPLIPQSSETAATTEIPDLESIDDESTFDIPTRIPSMIPQSFQPTATADTLDLEATDDENTINPPTRIPPLIPGSPQTPATTGTPDLEVPDDEYTFNIPTRIPPTIPGSSETAATTETPDLEVPDDENTFIKPTRIPPLIPGFSEPAATTDTPDLESTDDENTIKPPTRIPPLIPQPSEPAATTEISDLEVPADENTSNQPTTIPSLIPQSSQPPVPTSIPDSGASDDQNTVNEEATNFPPLIPQSVQPPATTSTSDSRPTDDQNIFNTPSSFPAPLIPTYLQPPVTIGTSDLGVNDDQSSSNVLAGIIPLILQSMRTGSMTGTSYLGGTGDQNTLDILTQFPPLIPQSLRPAATTETPDLPVFDDESTLKVPTEIPPLIFESLQPPTTTGTSDLGTVDDGKSNTVNTIPPLIEQPLQPAVTTGFPDLSVTDYQNTANTPIGIPPLISDVTKPALAPETDLTDVTDPTSKVDSSTGVPPLILQTSQPATSPGTTESSATDDRSSSTSTTGIPLLIPAIPESGESPGSASTLDTNQTHTIETPTSNSPAITQSSHSIDSTTVNPVHFPQGQPTFDLPPSVPSNTFPNSRPCDSPGTYPTNVFNQFQSPYPPINLPAFGIPWTPVGSSNSYHNHPYNSFYPWPGTAEVFFAYRAQHWWPLPFIPHQVPPWLLEHQFVPPPSTYNPAYGFRVPYGTMGPRTESTTFNSGGHVADTAENGFRINVADLPSSKGPHVTENTASSTLGNIYDLGLKFGPITDNVKEKSSAISRSVNETPLPVSDSEVSSVTDVPNIAVILQPPKYDNRFFNVDLNNADTHKQLGEPSTTRPSLIANIDNRNINLLGQVKDTSSSMMETGRQNVQNYAPEKSIEYNNDLRFTIRGAVVKPTMAPISRFGTIIGPNYNPPSTKFAFDTSGLKTPSSPSSDTNDGSTSLSDSANSFYDAYKESKMANVFRRVSSVGADLSAMSSASITPFNKFEVSEKSTPKTVVETTSIKPEDSHDTSGDVIPQVVGTKDSPFDLLNNGDNKPYEVSIVVNGDEDFDPSGDFITRLLEQHKINASLGFDGLDGYEIIKSENPEATGHAKNTKPTPGSISKPNLTLSSLPSSNPRISSAIQDNEKKEFASSNQNQTSDAKSPNPVPRLATILEPPKFDNFPRAFGSDSVNNLNSKQPSLSGDNAERDITNTHGLNISEFKADARDINGSLQSLLPPIEKVSESYPLQQEQILEQLTKHFGQPLYNDNLRNAFIPPEVGRSVDRKSEQQFTDLRKYQSGVKNVVSVQQQTLTSPEPPRTTTTTATPRPIKTVIKTEVLPSLSFSFDTQEERQQYAQAVLKGLLGGTQTPGSSKNLQ